MSPGSKPFWGKASRRSVCGGWGLLVPLSMVLNETSGSWGRVNASQMPDPSIILITLSVATSLGHPWKRTHMEGCVAETDLQGRHIHPSTHSFIQHIFIMKSHQICSQFYHSLGKTERSTNNWNSTGDFSILFHLASTCPRVREKWDSWVSLHFRGTSQLAESQVNNFVWGSARHHNLVPMLYIPMKFNIFNKQPHCIYYILGIILSVY